MKSSAQLIFTGLICLVGGIFSIVFPSASSLFVDSLIGWVFLISGISLLYAAFNISKLIGAMGIAGLALLAIGVFLLANPAEGLVALTVIVAIFFMIGGIARLLWARIWKESRSYWMALCSAAISILLGIMILTGIPASAETILGFFLGVELLMVGVPMVLLGLRMR